MTEIFYYFYRTCLDEGVPDNLLPGGVHSVAEALLLFVEALPEPVIPFALYEEALNATPNFSLCKEVIYVSIVYFILFIYLFF